MLGRQREKQFMLKQTPAIGDNKATRYSFIKGGEVKQRCCSLSPGRVVIMLYGQG